MEGAFFQEYAPKSEKSIDKPTGICYNCIR